MPLAHKLLYFLNSFSIGLLAPVLSLILCAHGASLETVSLFTGIFAVTVVVTELPSGIISDLAGRKKIFLLSHVFSGLCFLVMLFSREPVMLAAGCLFLGFGRSFSSGTMEALVIEQALLKKDVRLEQLNSTLASLECGALVAGSLAGGYLGHLAPTYTLCLLALIASELLILCFTIPSVKETPLPGQKKSLHKKAVPGKTLQNETILNEALPDKTVPKKAALDKESGPLSLLSVVKSSNILLTIFLMAIILGMLLSTVEIYWQPAFLSLLPEQFGWMLGIVSGCGYLGVIAGNFFCSRFLYRKGGAGSLKIRSYFALCLLLPLALLGMGFAPGWPLFLIFYVLLYFLLGAGNLIENTLLHTEADNRHRASMLSVYSLASKSGGMITSLLGALILRYGSLQAVWGILAGIALVSALIVLVWRKHISR